MTYGEILVNLGCAPVNFAWKHVHLTDLTFQASPIPEPTQLCPSYICTIVFARVFSILKVINFSSYNPGTSSHRHRQRVHPPLLVRKRCIAGSRVLNRWA